MKYQELFSYSFANIYFKRIMNIVDVNLKIRYIGTVCSSNKFVISPDVKYIQIDNKTRRFKLER